VADATRADGSHYEIAGLGGSWFRYAGNFQWSWQRDFFDVGNAGTIFLQMIGDGTLLPGMQQRIERAMSGERLPGHYPLARHPSGCGGPWFLGVRSRSATSLVARGANMTDKVLFEVNGAVAVITITILRSATRSMTTWTPPLRDTGRTQAATGRAGGRVARVGKAWSSGRDVSLLGPMSRADPP